MFVLPLWPKIRAMTLLSRPEQEWMLSISSTPLLYLFYQKVCRIRIADESNFRRVNLLRSRIASEPHLAHAVIEGEIRQYGRGGDDCGNAGKARRLSVRRATGDGICSADCAHLQQCVRRRQFK
jgi:hypothetical protein